MSGAAWWVGLDSWLLQDGNDADVVAGQWRQFALEYAYAPHRRLRPVQEATTASCRWTGRGTTYEVTGRLLRSSGSARADDAVRIDVGAQARA